MAKKTDRYADFPALCEAILGHKPVPEVVFAKPRKWRFDFCWPDLMLVLEVEGGVWSGGRHTRGSGFVKDMEKYNAAAALGYVVLRTTPTDLRKTATFDLLKRAIERQQTIYPKAA